jgi:hypothetical protein
MKWSFTMPLQNDKNVLIILDNLNEFAEKLLSQIADETSEGRHQLVAKIQQANNHYNKPIESPILGWIYWFSRTRGSDIDLAIKTIEAHTDAATRLKVLKLLVSEGQWHVGSFNHYLFEELIKGLPEYQPLDSEALEPVIKRLKELIFLKIDGFINKLTANQQLISSREKEELQGRVFTTAPSKDRPNRKRLNVSIYDGVASRIENHNTHLNAHIAAPEKDLNSNTLTKKALRRQRLDAETLRNINTLFKHSEAGKTSESSSSLLASITEEENITEDRPEEVTSHL